MRGRLSLWLLLSLGIHAGLVGLALVLIGPAPRPLPLLFVALVQGFLGVADPAPGGAVAAGDGRRPGAPGAAAPGALALRRAAGPAPGPAPTISPRTASAERTSAHAPSPTPDRVVTPDWTPAPERTPTSDPTPVPPRVALPERTPSTKTEPPPAAAGEPAGPPAQVVEAVPPGAAGTARLEGTTHGTHGGDGTAGGRNPGGWGAGATAGSGGRALAGDGLGLGLGAREGSVLALAVPGDGTGIGSEYQGYARLLRRRVQETLAYPPAAQRRQLTGSVELKVSVDTSGTIIDVALAASSSHRLLDEAALQAAREVERVPFPPDLSPRRLRIPVTVRFDLR